MVPLQHYAVGHALEKLFPEKWLRLGLRHGLHVAALSDALKLLSFGELVSHKVLTACLHVIEEDDTNVVFCRHHLEAHKSCRNQLFSLRIANISSSEMLSKSVQNYQFELWQVYNNFFEHVVEQLLIRFIKNS